MLTEQEARAPLINLQGRASERKLRLFACACCRRAWDWFDSESRNLVLLGERLADGRATNAERRAANVQANSRLDVYTLNHPANYAFCGITSPAFHGADLAIVHLPSKITCTLMGRAWQEVRHSREYERLYTTEQDHQQVLLRDIFGNTFEPVALDPAWRNSTAVALAQGIYDDRAFDRLPILADALQDAGCDNDDILNHCRHDTVHARGCWVVDAVLGKT